MVDIPSTRASIKNKLSTWFRTFEGRISKYLFVAYRYISLKT